MFGLPFSNVAVLLNLIGPHNRISLWNKLPSLNKVYIISYHIISYHITSHHITSRHVTSRHVTSHYITSHYIISHHIISYHIISYLIISHHITSHHIIISYHIISYRIASHRIASHHITSHHIISYHIISHHITSHHIITLYRIVSYRIASYRIASYRIVSYHISSNLIVSGFRMLYIPSQFFLQVYSKHDLWIGYNDIDNEGDWVWVDGMTSSYTNWDDKSPNNGGVSCAIVTTTGKWHDEPCQSQFSYICKKPSEGTAHSIWRKFAISLMPLFRPRWFVDNAHDPLRT